MKLLVENKADVNANGKDGETALHVAVGNGIFHFKILHIIFVRYKLSVICFIVHKGFEQIVQLLIRNEANTNLKCKGGLSPLHLTAENGNFHLTVPGVNVLL